MSRLAGSAAALAVTGVLLAGCGSSKSSSNSTPAAPAASTTATGTTSVPTAAGAAAIAACKQAIQAQTTLPATAKAKLESVCAKAAAGDKEAVKKAAREVCEEVIQKSAVPPGAQKEAALKACRQN